MCLGVPGRVVSCETNVLGMTVGTVVAGGVSRRVRLDYVPEVAIGDYVMVQMGFAVSVLGPEEAGDVLDALGQLTDLSGLDGADLPAGSGFLDRNRENN